MQHRRGPGQSALLDEVDATLTTIQVNLQARTFADFADFVAAGDRDRTVQTKWGCGTRCLTWIDRTSPGSGIGLGEETAADLYSPVGGPRIVATTRTYDPDRGTVVFYAASLWDSYVNEFTSHHDFIDEACFAVAIDTARRSMRSEWAECPEPAERLPAGPGGRRLDRHRPGRRGLPRGHLDRLHLGPAAPRRRLTQGDSASNRSATASPCAGRSSAFASATIASRTAASPVASYSMICCGRRNE